LRARGRRQDSVHQVDRRFHFGHRLQPAQASFGLAEQGTAEGAQLAVLLESLQLHAPELPIQRFRQQSFELGALHADWVLAWHQITCL
jgi:hypothetical protein